MIETKKMEDAEITEEDVMDAAIKIKLYCKSNRKLGHDCKKCIFKTKDFKCGIITNSLPNGWLCENKFVL